MEDDVKKSHLKHIGYDRREKFGLNDERNEERKIRGQEIRERKYGRYGTGTKFRNKKYGD